MEYLSLPAQLIFEKTSRSKEKEIGSQQFLMQSKNPALLSDDTL